MKAFFAKTWAALKWAWSKVVAVATFIRDFAVWCKERMAKKDA